MHWTQLEQKETFLENRSQLNGAIYKDQLLIFGKGFESKSRSKSKLKSKTKSESDKAMGDEQAQENSDYDSDVSQDEGAARSKIHCWNISNHKTIFL